MERDLRALVRTTLAEFCDSGLFCCSCFFFSGNSLFQYIWRRLVGRTLSGNSNSEKCFCKEVDVIC